MKKMSKNITKKTKILSIAKTRNIAVMVSLSLLFNTVQAKGKAVWTGLHSGVNASVIFNDAHLSANNLGFTMPEGYCNQSSAFSNFFTGLQLGYTHQFNMFVLGLDLNYAYYFNKQDNMACACEINPIVSDQFAIINHQQGSLRGRLGYAYKNNLLPFIMIGENLTNLGMNYHNEGGDYYSKNTTTLGSLIGAGLEWKFTQAGSIRVEYSHSFNNNLKMKIPMIYELYDPNGSAKASLYANTIGLVANYWF